MKAGEVSAEARRIQAVYAQREAGGREDRRNAGRRLMEEERDRLFARVLRRRMPVPLGAADILDVGCGDGRQLAWFAAAGADARRLNGVDLLPDKIARARERYPDFNLVPLNAETLPFPDRSFDLVVCMTVFSSILDDAMARNVAAQMRRVLRPGGLILWYDMRYPNPWNRNVRPMTEARIAGLFPGFGRFLVTATLIPQIARGIGHLGPAALARTYAALAGVPLLRSHLIGVLEAPESDDALAA